ncbi:hypothetical protein NE237_011616 [Protea cynaroides]|uniref:TF-B3 domain-containing protein n=1 Tax=Protea cynaroides TaxID=273540 RepID=A0A9Q0GY89_9MAGN|nr:hypothetical protein NE237_011616 [Protea cynaroides]
MMRQIHFQDFVNPENPPEEIEIRIDNVLPDLHQHWLVKQYLTKKDIENDQLVLPGVQVKDHILLHLLPNDQEFVNCHHYLPITIRDHDTKTECQLSLWKNASNSYVLTQGWKSCFVSRRGLKVGEEVGFRLAKGVELQFTILSRQKENNSKEPIRLPLVSHLNSALFRMM